jgi:hypothetical protein
MDMTPVIAHLSVDASAAPGTISLTLRNQSTQPVLIDPYNLCLEGTLKGKVFEIVDGSGRRVRYIGRLFKRGEPKFSQFIPLSPGATLVQQCNLALSYDLSTARRPLTIRYSVYNMDPQKTYFKIESNSLRADL